MKVSKFDKWKGDLSYLWSSTELPNTFFWEVMKTFIFFFGIRTKINKPSKGTNSDCMLQLKPTFISFVNYIIGYFTKVIQGAST